METRKVSWKTITYARVDTLEECLYSFLNQEWEGEKEMIIVNDCPFQTLHFDHPLVKIYNLENTFPILGDKENFAVSKCTGDIIIVGDDDDIALPNHLSNIQRWFEEGTDLLHWKRAVFAVDNDIRAITGVGNSGICYSRKIWEKVRYPKENAGYDSTYVYNIRQAGGRVVFAAPEDNEVSWFYRWGSSSPNGVYHNSGMGTDVPGRPDIVQRHSAFIESLRQQGKVPEGDIELKPHWKKDYKQMLQTYVRQNQRLHR